MLLGASKVSLLFRDSLVSLKYPILPLLNALGFAAITGSDTVHLCIDWTAMCHLESSLSPLTLQGSALEVAAHHERRCVLMGENLEQGGRPADVGCKNRGWGGCCPEPLQLWKLQGRPQGWVNCHSSPVSLSGQLGTASGEQSWPGCWVVIRSSGPTSKPKPQDVACHENRVTAEVPS